ncbi:MAG: nicotinate (nicotinamide) nucleotide adenylyltransferase [Oscillospiraceae bacterium]|nr:nicotinate (nicotinamide) nucleotide adenylyltransferase [Oscillospiraceae bacterium]
MAGRIALYGGTFDPPHNGHTAAIRAVLDALAPGALYWMPARQAPHKGEAAAGAEHRLAMCRLAAAELGSRVTVSGHEMGSGVSGYTVDTLAWLSGREPDAELWLVVGQDMLRSLGQWRDPARLLGLCRVAALCRAEGQGPDMDEAAERLRTHYGAVVRRIEHEPVEISSTQLRAMLGHGEGKDFLPGAVWNYIQENTLYRA